MTRDEKSGEVKEIIRKVRLGNLDVYSPKRQVDWRLSVNMEVRGTSFPFTDLVNSFLTKCHSNSATPCRHTKPLATKGSHVLLA